MDFLSNWNEEKNSAYLYKLVANREKQKSHQQLFMELAVMAEKQAALWEKELTKAGTPIPAYRPNWRTRFIGKLIALLGPKQLRLVLAATKVRGMSLYRNQSLVRQFPDILGDPEHQHTPIKHSNNLRAAVFGINDGLVSNASLMLGVAGAQVNSGIIVLTGIAGLLAGAFSMGSGEYVSVRSQREMVEYQLELEKHELDTYPEEEAAELALIYQARGIPKEDAERIANLLIQDPEKALDTLAREELGINPDELVSPWGAAISSFVSFVVGAFVPLIPFLFFKSEYNLYISVSVTALALFIVGATLSLFTQRNAWWSGLRTLLIGLTAGAFTYVIGMALGAKSLII
jgi:VIT1/CCC1 family predicted Fe2+/Mn2+ transporter